MADAPERTKKAIWPVLLVLFILGSLIAAGALLRSDPSTRIEKLTSTMTNLPNTIKNWVTKSLPENIVKIIPDDLKTSLTSGKSMLSSAYLWKSLLAALVIFGLLFIVLSLNKTSSELFSYKENKVRAVIAYLLLAALSIYLAALLKGASLMKLDTVSWFFNISGCYVYNCVVHYPENRLSRKP